MAHWTILCAERYLSILYDYLHERLYDYHVLQADETPVLVSKENRTTGSKHYMWVYRTGKMYLDRQIVLYDYQPSRNASHPRAFLKDFQGVCVTDGYQVYHTIEKEREDLRIAGAESSAIIYSLAETAKANNLKPYNYFEYLLTEISKHMDDHDTSF
jgi:hypothetical protein